jgi:hypothetical protein
VEFEKQPHMLKAVVDLFIDVLLEVLDSGFQINPQVVHPFVVVQHGGNRTYDSQDRESDADNQCQNLCVSQFEFLLPDDVRLISLF